MNEHKQILLLLKGAISEATEEERAAINEAAKKIMATVDEHGEPGQIALVLCAAELAAKPE